MTAPELSLVIPVYEEEENLPILLREIREALGPTGRTWEALLVDDGSGDTSWAVIQAEADQNVRGLRFAQNRGQTAAFAAGVRAARGRLVITLDSDLQNDPADIPRMVDELEKNDGDVVLGIRANRRDNFVRRMSSKIANSYRRWRTNDDTIDTGCSLKVFKREYIIGMPFFTGMHRYLPTLARMEGATKIVQVPVNHRPRVHGVAKYGVWNRLWVGIADVRAVRWMQKRNLAYKVAEEVGGAAEQPTPKAEAVR